MVEIPAARPVDGVSNLPAVAGQPLEHPPHFRLRLGADPAARGQAESAAACRRQPARQHHERQRQAELAGPGDEHRPPPARLPRARRVTPPV